MISVSVPAPQVTVLSPQVKAHIGGRTGGGALVQAVLGVGLQMELHAGSALDGVGHGVQTAVAHRGDHLALAVQVQRDGGGDAVDLSKVCLDEH